MDANANMDQPRLTTGPRTAITSLKQPELPGNGFTPICTTPLAAGLLPPPARPSRFRSIRGALCTRRLAAGLQASDHLKGAAAGRRHQPGKPEQHQAGQA